MKLTEAQKSACLRSKQEMWARVGALQQRKAALRETLLRQNGLEDGDPFETVRAQLATAGATSIKIEVLWQDCSLVLTPDKR